MIFKRASLLAVCGLLACLHAHAAYPEKPIRIVTPFPAGSVTDIIARPMALKLTEAWGVPVIVDNRTGAGGTVAGDVVAKAPPDGHTLVIGATGLAIVNALLYQKMPYDSQRAFAPVTMAATAGMMLVVHPSIPLQNVKDLITLGKSRPGQFTYGSSGNGSTPHLAAVLFTSMTGVQMIHVAYKGGSPQYTIDLITGRLELAFASMAPVIPHVKSNRLRALGVTSMKRTQAAPDVPTLDEQGITGFNADTVFGLYAPAATPPQTINRLHAEINRLLRDGPAKDQILQSGQVPQAQTIEQFTRGTQADYERYGIIIKASGIRAE